MNVDELTGADLNEAVAKRLGIVHTHYNGQVVDQFGNPLMYDEDWALAGEIIEVERMGVWNCEAVVDADGNVERDKCWYAEDKDGDHVQTGPTPLIAAMRCYVASKQGETSCQ
tara:strand:+ start:51 stop:389 length:339 start_codon:yes stop_codon:yes gene_type:complete